MRRCSPSSPPVGRVRSRPWRLRLEPARAGCTRHRAAVRQGVRGRRVGLVDGGADAGRGLEGEHLFQIAEGRIQKIDPKTGRVLATIPAPDGGGNSGLAWAEGMLWVGQYEDRKIHQVDPQTGAILRTIEASRFVTGVTWIDGELWHGTWGDDESELRRLDPRTV